MTSEKTIYLIDGSAYIYRAYHAIRGLSNSKGLPTNAVFGFTKMMLKLMGEKTPEYAAICFDAKGPTFRHDIYDQYKATRPPMPEDLVVQIPYIKQVVQGFNMPVVELAGFEADDLIGTLARKAQAEGFSVVMATGDKDFLQLITDRAVVWDPMKEKITTRTGIQETMGIKPHQIIDVMALSGDASDNIPGVSGIGPKTALSLIQTFGDIESLYGRIDSITKVKQRENLMRDKEQAFLSKKLVVIEVNAPMAHNLEDFKWTAPDAEKLYDLFKHLEFKQLMQAFQKETDLSKKQYHMVCDTSALSDLLAILKNAPLMALDTETTSKHPMLAKLVGVSISVKPDEAYYIPVGHHYLGAPEQIPLDDVLRLLKPVLENPKIKKIGQNIKYDWIILDRYGIDLAGVEFDTMLASYLLNPSKRAHNLDQIALDFLDHKTITYQEVAGKGKNAVEFSQVTLDKAAPYACEDADITLMAREVLRPRIEKEGLLSLLETVEMPLVRVLKNMEQKGISVDAGKLTDLSKFFKSELDRIQDDIYLLAGERFNINSSQQLGRILFEKLDLPVHKKTKKKTGYSTDVEVLTMLAEKHELPAMVLRHRTLAKLKSTYTDALLALVHPETGRIHTSYNQTVTATGRLSSSDPNLQNIPVRTDEGRKIRSAFIPRPGWRLVSADYSQIELRILAHCSEDDILIQAFKDGEDIHTRTAGEVFGIDPDTVHPDLRRQAKAINFGIIYGMSAFGLSKQLHISQKMAKIYIDNYFSRYQGVKRFMDRAVEDARSTSQTSTLLGRIRLLPDINSPNRTVRQFAERTAINTPIQGSAADLIKVAMIRVDETLAKKGLRSAMLLSVHDELLFEVPQDELDEATALVKSIMEGVWDLKAPLKVNVDWGENWAEAH
ncbi:DNA polymerase I [Thermodesulfobacteriota bacterium]